MRFRVERRSGIVAVYDTEHPEYQDTPGCLDDYPWTVCSWHGTFDEKAGHWKVDQRWIDKARAACELLNTLSANNTGERARNPLGKETGDDEGLHPRPTWRLLS